MQAIINIGELVVVPPGPVPGRSMNKVASIPNAAVLLDGETIHWFGRQADCTFPPNCTNHDAGGGCVIPGLIDCHTHSIFSGSREAEFVQRIAGTSYSEIAKSGGGIKVSVEAVRTASCEQLVDLTLPRLARMLRRGVTTVEIKSGYGLTIEDELKMLRAIKIARERQPIELVATYLAAHTTPREFEGKSDAYLDTVLDSEVLSRIRDDKLAEFCDVFCEETAFDVEQSHRVLTTAASFGLRGKVHADQITQIGATVMAGEVGAISADHLETTGEDGIHSMKRAGTIAVVLPACSFFLGVPQARGRDLIDADLPVAVATDFNPGSSMVESLPLALSIGCTQMRLTPTEALVGATANAAAAINRHSRLGAMAKGMQADLVILDVPNHQRWLYELGRNCVAKVFKAGRLVVENNSGDCIA